MAMTVAATGTIESETWDEALPSETGAKLARVTATDRFRGTVVGEATLGYLLCYADAKAGEAIGYEPALEIP